jgi:exosortase D (VPLPA-CTERM-specific)
MEANARDPDAAATYRNGRVIVALLAAMALVTLSSFHASGTFQYLWQQWQLPEFSHGVLIPAISLFLVWQRWPRIAPLPFTGSGLGLAVIIAGWLIYLLGAMASITTLDAYALVVLVNGFALSLLGWRAYRVMAVPLLLLFLMNPIPQFFFNSLSAALQLLSSQIGVAVIRLFGISVYLEGNLIDLGSYRLQVVEACSGLRYLFPLLTLGLVTTCLLDLRRWMAATLVVSTVPVTILMNSFRIGVVGVLVDRFGPGQAEGFLHDFEGWVIFMACLLILLAELALLMRLTGDRRPLRDVVAFDWPTAAAPAAAPQIRRPPWQAWLAIVLMLALVLPAHWLPRQTEVPPERADFTTWPAELADWKGRRDRLDPQVHDWLGVDDYLLADYRQPDGAVVNLYIAYYASQRSGQAAHSPASCLPGGGWKMTGFGRHSVASGVQGAPPMAVNRVLIEQSGTRQLVYYWFQQRGRILTNEYAVKGYLLVDALRRNRTDGALVRLVTPLHPNESTAAADERLQDLLRVVAPRMPAYVPD